MNLVNNGTFDDRSCRLDQAVGPGTRLTIGRRRTRIDQPGTPGVDCRSAIAVARIAPTVLTYRGGSINQRIPILFGQDQYAKVGSGADTVTLLSGAAMMMLPAQFNSFNFVVNTSALLWI